MLLLLKLLENKTWYNKIIERKTEQLCHHRPQTKAHSNEYENNTHKAGQAVPAWRGAGRSSRDTKPPLSSSDGARSLLLRCCCCWNYLKRIQTLLLLLKLLEKKTHKIACYYAAAFAEITRK